MHLTSNTNEIQRLTGRIAALSRFVSRSSYKYRPFFKVLKKAFHRYAQCKEALSTLKTYLSSPHVLVSPSEGELLTLYLAVLKFSTSAALVRERDGIQQPVYYCSRVLRGAEERYLKMEKLILALVTTARRLQPYFQTHTIEVPTEHQMRQILQLLETSERLIKWAIELNEFDIRYKSRTTVKGQVLADFIMEFTPSNTPAQPTETTKLAPNLPIWRLSVDGAANS